MSYLERLREFSNTPDSEAAKPAETPFAAFAGPTSELSENFSAPSASPDLVRDHEALEERAAILEHEAGLSRDEADAQALPATVPRPLSVAEAVKGRVWDITFRDGATCVVLMPEPMSQEEAEADLRRGPLGHRTVKVEEHRP